MRKSRKTRRRLRFGRLFVVLLAAATTGGAVFGLHTVQTGRNAGNLRTRAEQATAAGDAAAAGRLYKSYVRLRPADADGLAKYAETLESQLKAMPALLNETVQTYERLFRVDPNRPDERRKLVRLYLQAQALPNARMHLGILFAGGRGAADDPGLHDLAALCDERERLFPPAAEHLRKVIAAPDAAPDAFARLAAIIRAELGGPEPVKEADALMESLVQKRPADAKSWLTRADYFLRFGDKAAARKDVEHVYETVPGGADDPAVLQTLAGLYLDADDENSVRKAERLLQKAVAGGTAPARIRLALADVQVRLDQTDAARQTLRDAAEKVPADVALLEVADRLIDLKEVPAAEAAAERLKGMPGPVGDYLRGRLKLSAGEWATAAPLLQAAVDGLDKLPNQRFRAYLGLADAAALANDTPARLAAYDNALRLDPGSAIARLGRAECLARQGRTRDAEDAYQGLTAQEPAARAAIAGLRLAEQMALPAADRRWETVDVACGAEPFPPTMAVVKARSLVARGRAAEAVAVLDRATDKSPLPGAVVLGHDAGPSPLAEAVVELALLKAALGDRPGAFAVLDKAGLGDRAALRLARARLLAGDTPADWAAVAAVGDPAGLGQMSKDERYRLLAGLGDLFAGANKPAEAVALLKRAAAERPTDLVSRAALFNLALATRDEPLQAELMAEFERVEGKDGPVKATAEAARVIPTLKPDDPAITGWRDRLKAALAKRSGWGLIHHLLGRLDELAGNADAAADGYRQAFALGERSEGLVRSLYAALLRRQQYAEAFDVLGRVARERPLPDDLAKELLRLQVAFGDDPAKALAWASSPEAVASASDRDQLLRADALLAAGKPADAVAPLKKAVSLNPKNAVAWVGLTRLLAALGKDGEAKAAAADAAAKLAEVAAPPADRAAALTAAGTCRELVGDRPAAEAAYRAAAAADPTATAAEEALVRLLARTNRAADAEAHLRQLTVSAPPAVKRWARRQLAFASLERPDWYGRLPTALTLVEQNLADGNNLAEDVRAKGLLLSADPLRADEAVTLLAEAKRTGPLSPDHAYQLARLYLRQQEPAKAEAVLRDATRSVPVPAPELLGLLVKVQVDAKSVGAARRTFERLKQLDPKAPEAGVAEARVLAAENNKAAAAARLEAVAGTADLAAVAAFAGPLLEEMGCFAEAEAVYRKATGPVAPIRLAAFYLRRNRPTDVVQTLLPGDGSAPVGLSARLLAGAVRTSPAAALPEPERTNALRLAKQVTAWVGEKLAAAPADPHLLAAAATLATVGDNPGEVVPAFQRALAAAPDDPTAKANLAFAKAVYARDGTEATLALIQSAIDAAGPSAALLDTRGLVHLVGGRVEAAVRDLTTAYSLEPKPAYAFHLVQAYDAASDRPDNARLRDQALDDAIRRRGLTKAVLDPREWAEFDRLTAPPLASPKR